MAYMNQERKAKIAALLKPLLKEYGVKGTLSVRNHSTIVMTIAAGGIDFIGNYEAKRGIEPDSRAHLDVNVYHYRDHFDGKALEFLSKAIPILNLSGDADANFDKSEPMTDYFHVGWYVDVQVGKWDKPYLLK